MTLLHVLFRIAMLFSIYVAFSISPVGITSPDNIMAVRGMIVGLAIIAIGISFIFEE